MSKLVMSLPQGMVKNSVVGGVLALASYVALQFVCALLVDRGVLGMESLYPMVCVAAALASFLGCGYSVLRGKGGAMLTVPVGGRYPRYFKSLLPTSSQNVRGVY